jgi:hypothetical protein
VIEYSRCHGRLGSFQSQVVYRYPPPGQRRTLRKWTQPCNGDIVRNHAEGVS